MQHQIQQQHKSLISSETTQNTKLQSCELVLKKQEARQIELEIRNESLRAKKKGCDFFRKKLKKRLIGM